MNSVVGDICMEIDGIDREVRVTLVHPLLLLKHLVSIGISSVTGAPICERAFLDG